MKRSNSLKNELSILRVTIWPVIVVDLCRAEKVRAYGANEHIVRVEKNEPMSRVIGGSVSL